MAFYEEPPRAATLRALGAQGLMTVPRVPLSPTDIDAAYNIAKARGKRFPNNPFDFDGRSPCNSGRLLLESPPSILRSAIRTATQRPIST